MAKKNTANTCTACPIDSFLKILMGPWTTYILWLVRSNGPQRFGQLKKQMPGISAKVLTQRLRMLEEADILSREQENTIPPKVTYSLTARGKELNRILDDIAKVAVKWSADEDKKRKKASS